MGRIRFFYMLMGVAFSAVFTNMVNEVRLKEITDCFSPILAVSLLAAIVDLGAPLNYRLILGAGAYTFLYIAARGFGKYFGARIGATVTKMPDSVKKYLGLTLLLHSGVSLVFTGIVCFTHCLIKKLRWLKDIQYIVAWLNSLFKHTRQSVQKGEKRKKKQKKGVDKGGNK